jgi:phosphoglycolate phosphatase-like HAD superfamily hydrolase
MQDARWLFFDLGNTLISEERAWERRIQRLASSLERYGRRRAIEEVRAALREASEEFAPRLITRAIEKLIDLEYRKLILAEARYDKELESPCEGAEETLRKLLSRYRIGVIANQPAGTEERLVKWGLMPFISICLSSTEVGLEKPAIFAPMSGIEPNSPDRESVCSISSWNSRYTWKAVGDSRSAGGDSAMSSRILKTSPANAFPIGLSPGTRFSDQPRQTKRACARVEVGKLRPKKYLPAARGNRAANPALNLPAPAHIDQHPGGSL